MAADVGKHGERSGGDHRAADGQAVQTVGEVHGVAGSHNHEHHENHERQKRQRPELRIVPQAVDHQVGPELLEERHHQVGGVLSAVCKTISATAIRTLVSNLEPSLARAGQAEVAAVHDFEVVVGKPDGREGAGGKHGDPDERCSGRPQQRRHEDGDRDQQAAHGRRAGFLLVRLRAFFADVLADLEFAQPANDDRADDQPVNSAVRLAKAVRKVR